MELESVLPEYKQPNEIAHTIFKRFAYWKINSHLASKTKVRIKLVDVVTKYSNHVSTKF